MQFVNEQLKISTVPDQAVPFSSWPAAQRYPVVQAILGRLDLIEAFVTANPAGLSPEELDLVRSWRYLVAGRFIALRRLKKYFIFLPCDWTATAYGVVALSEPLTQVIPMPLPAMIETVLLPSGIIRTIGLVNFLDDRSQSPHLKFPEIDRAFGVAESTGQGKAKAIRQMLKKSEAAHRTSE